MNQGRKEERQKQAKERNAEWAKYTPAQKLESLERRGHGHCKQAKILRGEDPNG